jgi:hypothetical protein
MTRSPRSTVPTPPTEVASLKPVMLFSIRRSPVLTMVKLRIVEAASQS